MDILSKETKELLKRPGVMDALQRLVGSNVESLTVQTSKGPVTLRKVDV